MMNLEAGMGNGMWRVRDGFKIAWRRRRAVQPLGQSVNGSNGCTRFVLKVFPRILSRSHWRHGAQLWITSEATWCRNGRIRDW